MKVQVIHALPSVGSDVRHDSITGIKPFRGSRLCSDSHQMPQQVRIVVLGRGQRLEGLFGDDQEMGWCLRADVAERECQIIFVENVGWDLAPDYLAKNRLWHGSDEFSGAVGAFSKL